MAQRTYREDMEYQLDQWLATHGHLCTSQAMVEVLEAMIKRIEEESGE